MRVLRSPCQREKILPYGEIFFASQRERKMILMRWRTMSKKIYDMITNKIIEKLGAGTVPWRQPFVNGIAVNWKTQKPYRGINTMLLDGGEYATFNQIKEAGGNVKKGEKSHIVVFWKWLEKEDEESGEIENIPYLRYYRVFEVGSQVEGLEPKRKERAYQHDPIQEAEKIKEQYVNAPSYSYISGSAYYKPFQDHINVPPKEDFRSIHEYYSTLFHELIHSTGHKDRLNRSGITAYNGFGSESYSKRRTHCRAWCFDVMWYCRN